MFAEKVLPPQEIVFHMQDEAIQIHRQHLADLTRNNLLVLARFDEFVVTTKSDPNFSKFLEAVCFAAEKHFGQTRKDFAATPYIFHPIGVALSLWEEGLVKDPVVIIAALLHDTLEDTSATKEEIESLFGLQVSEIIGELTNPDELSSEEAKTWQVSHAPSLSNEAKLVKLADRLYNIRDLRVPPVGWSEEKVQGYYVWGQKLLDVLKGTNFQLEQLLQDEIHAHQ